MNRIHRKIWSARLGAFVAVAETARGRSKQPGGAVTASVLALSLWAALPALAATPGPGTLPTGGTVTAGSAAITRNGQTMTITQGTQRAAINWQGFSIAKDASVTFAQPSTTAVMLNRVTGTEQSVIDGALRANGQVFLLNPNGVLFTANSRVDTAGLVASTRNLSDADFMAGRTTFSGAGSGDVVNAGQLNAADGGYVALIGRQVRNDGVISARLGTVALASGDRVSLNFDGSSLVGVTIDQGALAALVSNGGAIMADGGTVLLKASAASGLLDTVVNNTGQIRAQSVGERNGKIYLLGEGGRVEVAGSLDASNPGLGSGGFIETSGPEVSVKENTRITTAAADAAGSNGTWLIDPTDFTISAGNGAPSASGIGVNVLQSALSASNVTVQTVSSGSGVGNINIDAPLAWSANLLTLEAFGDINVNAVVSATGSSRLNLKTGYNFNTGAPTFDLSKTVRMKWQVDGSGNPTFAGRIDFDRTGTGILTINNSGYILINALGASGSTTGTDLQGINGNLSGKYALASNIDATASAGFGSWSSSSGFNPIGRVAGFTGVLDGLGHVVNNYTFLANDGNLGLVGQLNSINAAVRNIGVTNINLGGNTPPNFGGLVGLLNAGSVSNSFATGTMISFSPQSGGLVGLASAGTSISQSYAKVNLQNGAGDAGGLVGHAGTGVVIRDSMAAGNVDSPFGNNAGGLLGSSDGASVINSSASGDVSGVNYVGGVVGLLQGVSLISNAHGTGNVSGANAIGGLVGGVVAGGSFATQILNSDASGDVTASNSSAGGLIGVANGGGAAAAAQIVNSHAAGGTVTGPGLIGGLVGDLNAVNVSNSYADMTVVSSQAGAFWFGGLVGRASNMTLLSSYAIGDVDVSVGNGRYVGGLMGESVNGTFTNVYARGDVNAVGGRWVGGLVGYNTATISNAYSTGQVTGSTNTGGLIGQAAGGSVTNSFWDVQTSGWGTAGSTAGSAGGIGRSTADMTSTATYTAAGWNFTLGTGVWGRRDDLNDKYPVLRAFGYTDRIATLLIDPTWLASTAATPVVYTTTGLLGGDTLSLTATGGLLSYTANLASAGNYDGIQVASRAVSGDLTINRPLAWNNFLLGLEAAGNVNINAVLSATGTAQLNLKTGYNFNSASPVYASGYRVNMGMDATHAFTGRVDIDRTGTGILNINNSGYTLINALGASGSTTGTDLQGINGNLGGNYALASNIDASATAGWNSGAGFTPLAGSATPYTGRFEGLGHSITGLSINQTAPRNVSLYQVGLFARADNASFSNLALTGVNITGPGQVGALLGATINNPSSIANVTVSGTVTGTNASGGSGSNVGGLIGLINNVGTSVVNAHSTATVSASADNVGGLIGASTGAVIDSSSATGTVNGSNAVGGLLGKGQTSTVITYGSATGAVTGQNGVGGLVGVLDSQSGANSISGGFATGNVIGNENVGGLVGDSPYSGTVIGLSYATGAVRALRFVGGFIGTGNASITDAYATGNVTATDPSVAFAGGFSGGGAGTIVLNRVYSSGVVTAADLGNSFGSGGLSGFGFYTVINSFYDATKNPNGAAIGLGTGKTTAQMTDSATYQAAGWDFTFGSGGVWGRKSSQNNGYPVLKIFGYAEPIVVNLGVSSRSYGDANPSLAGATITGCPTINCAGLITSLSWGSALDASTHAGGYALSGANVLSYSYGGGMSASNFDITYVIPTFTVAPRVVSVTAVSGATRVYDGTASAAAGLFTVGNIVNGDTVTLSGSATLGSIHAGNRGVSSNGTLALSNADYQLAVTAPTGNVLVTPRIVTVAASSGATRVYDGTADAAASLFTLGNVVSGDTVTLNGSAVLDSVHAGNRGVSSGGTLALNNADYQLAVGLPTGNVLVTPRIVGLAAVSGATRAYDGTADAAAGLFSLSNVVSGDTVTLSGSAALDSVHAGNRSVASNGTLALSNSDYQLAVTAPSGNVLVTPRIVGVTAASGATRVYDGTADAAAGLFTLSNVVSGDTVTLSGSAALDSVHAGSRGVASNGTLALSNSDYQLAVTAPSGNVLVTPRIVGVTAVSGATRVYDGTADAAAGLFTLSNVVSGDTVTLSGSAALDSVHAGSRGVASNGTLALSNSDYQLAVTAPSGNVLVTPRIVGVTTVSGATRVYDGTADAAASLFTLSNVISGDNVALSGSAVLDSVHAGNRGVSSGGTLALSNSDYQLAVTAPSGTVLVTPRVVTVTAGSGASRVYDGTAGADAGLLIAGNVVGTDNIGLTGSASLDSAHAGSRTLNGLGTLSLANSDYVLAVTAPSGTVTITPRALQASFLPGATRVFDGTADAAASLFTLSGLLGPDTAVLSGNAVLDSAQVGTRQVAGIGTLSLSNTDYTLSGLPGGSLTITAQPPAVKPGPDESVISAAQRTLVLPEPPLPPTASSTPLTLAGPVSNVVDAPPGISVLLGAGSPLLVLSAPSSDEPTEGVTLTQARRMVGAPSDQAVTSNARDLRVPVSRNSLAEIVNGGVKLPGGVDQVLFVVKAAR